MRAEPWMVLAGEPEVPADMLALAEVYERMDEATAQWARTAGITCPTGCGRCSAVTDPECLPIEAEYAARLLLSLMPDEVPGLMERLRAATPVTGGDAPHTNTAGSARAATTPCPLYRADSPHHCSVYRARMVLCRLFGYAAMLARNGEWQYRLCVHMQPPAGWDGRRTITASDCAALKGTDAAPPVMAHYRSMVEDIRPSESNRRAPLSFQLLEALERLMLRRQLLGAAAFAAFRVEPGDNDPNNSDPAPIGRAG